MKRVLVFVAAFLAAGVSRAQVPPPLINPVGSTTPDPTALRGDSSVDEILDALQARGKSLKEFVADVTLTDTDIVMGDSSKRTGKVWYQLRDDDNARMHIFFDKKLVDDKPPRDDRKEYLLEDGWAVDRDYLHKSETKYQIARAGEKMNLFQLGKGAFPLPIGQDKSDVHGMFDVTRIPAAKDDPLNTVHLQLKPKSKTDFEKKFSAIDVWVDFVTKMPVRISTEDKNHANQQQTDLEDLKVNPKPGLKDEDFTVPPIDDAGWNRHEEPLP